MKVKHLIQLFRAAPLSFLIKTSYKILGKITFTLKSFSNIVLISTSDLVGWIQLSSLKKKINISQNNKSWCKDSSKGVALVCRNGAYGNGIDPSLEKIQLDDTLEHVGYSVQTFIWDDRRSLFRARIDFINHIAKIKPNLIIFSSYSFRRRNKNQPSREFIKEVKRVFSETKFCAVWWDTASKNFWKNFPIEDPFDLNVIIDNPKMTDEIIAASGTVNFDNFLFLFPPYVYGQHFYPEDKEIDIFFGGQISDYRDTRKPFIDYLSQNQPTAVLKTDNRISHLSWEKYSEMMRKSAIILNFSESVDTHQFKGRAIEALFSQG
ncbi:MAG: hypothetical protein ACPGKG_09030, partial [Paracoccaceae bacterium]